MSAMLKRRSGWLWTAYGLLIFSSFKNISNPDLFWHLSAGERILTDWRLPDADWLSFTRAGAPWVDFEWLSQVLFTLLYRAVGWWGLIALKIALLVGAARIIEGALAKRGLGVLERACAVAVLTAVWSISNDLRLDCLSVLLLCAQLSALERLRAGAKIDLWKAALAAAAVGALWANCHAGFVVGLAVAGAYAFLCPVSTRKAALAVLVGGFLGTLITPFGPRLYSVVFAHLRLMSPLARYIVEWHWSAPGKTLTWPAWALFAGCLLSAWIAPPKRRELAPWAVLAGLAVMALRHQRHIAYFAAAGVLLPPLLLEERGGFKLHRLCAPLAVLLAAVFLLLTPQDLSRSGLRVRGLPVGAAEFLASRPDVAQRRLYNPWGWGGYLGWRLKKPYRVFYDGRYIFHDLLAPSMEARKDPKEWNLYLDEQKLDGAVLDRQEQDLRVTWLDEAGVKRERVVPYFIVFMPRERWKLVYLDETAVIYIRR